MTQHAMTRRELATLLCRLLALYVLFIAVGTTLLYVPEVVRAISPEGAEQREMLAEFTGESPRSQGQVVLTLVAAMAVPWIAAAAYWFGARWLAQRMISEGPLPGLSEQVDGATMLAVAMVILGLLWVLHGLQGVLGAVDNADMVGRLVQLVAGLWLILGVKGNMTLLRKLRGGVQWLRTAGTHPSTDDGGK